MMEVAPISAADEAPAPATLGVVAISYNEERDLPGFITNLLSWVDEIVIVDDGSTDATERIATEAGPKVKFLRTPRGEGEYFSHQRNKGIDAATSDWLLHMDIDERVSPELATEIRRAIEAGGKDAYRFRRLNYFMHRPMYGGGFQDWNLVHLARREALRFGGMFHESCDVTAPEGRIGQLTERMVHLNEDSFAKRLRKSDTYLEEVVQGFETRGTRIGAFAMVYYPAKEFAKKYVLKRGYRDGTPGLIFAIHAATAQFRACASLWDKRNRITREEVEDTLQAAWSQESGGSRPEGDA